MFLDARTKVYERMQMLLLRKDSLEYYFQVMLLKQSELLNACIAISVSRCGTTLKKLLPFSEYMSLEKEAALSLPQLQGCVSCLAESNN